MYADVSDEIPAEGRCEREIFGERVLTDLVS